MTSRSGPREFTYDVFISYSHEDRLFARQLATDLSGAGFRVWLDQWNLKVGDSIAEGIDDAMRLSRFVLTVMSPDYFKSAWASQEWQYGLAEELDSGGVRVIPILHRDCTVPPMLSVKMNVDLRDGSKYQPVLARLIRDLDELKSDATPAGRGTKEPRSGERVEQLDAQSVAELKKALKDAVEAFRAQPSTQAPAPSPTELEGIDDSMCFIVMPFGVESLGIVYEDFVKPVLADRCMLRPERGDDVFGSNVIMDDITRSIRRARLIIADLTGRNANVFYEVGIAHALNKQVLLMTQSIDDVPFDLRYRRALLYEYSPRGCKKLENDLYANVQDMLAHREKT